MLAQYDCGTAYSRNPTDDDARLKAERHASVAYQTQLVLSFFDAIVDETTPPNLELVTITT